MFPNTISTRFFRFAGLVGRFTAGCVGLGLHVTMAQAQAGRPDVTIDAKTRTEAVSNLAKEIEANYFDARTGAGIAKELRNDLRTGRYSQASAIELSTILTEDLRRLSGDPHFKVDYFVIPRTFPAAVASQDPVSEADRRLTLRLQNFGFARVERLPGNVGYLKLDAFELPSVSGETAGAAMQFLSGTDALIIDLRDNRGGYGTMAVFMASYFFADPVHLSDRIGRDPADLKQTWTYAVVPGPRYLDKPVYVLSGSRTFSAAESFAYDLQSQKRATLVGETTRGGANMAAQLLLSPRFGVIMPIARVRNTVTGGNWEGGLKPDVSTSATRALSTAHLSALEVIVSKHRDDPLTQEIERNIARLKAELAATTPRP